MSKYSQQIIIESPLWEFMSHCEVYCTAGCCEKNAFKIHPALLLRKKIDENISGNDGSTLLKTAREQLKVLKEKITNKDYDTEKGQIPVWHNADKDLPEYWLYEDGAVEWFEQWDRAFEKAVKGELANNG